jgi:hypothetical protein
MDIYFFSIDHTFLLAYENFRERLMKMNEVFIFVDEKTCFCVTLSVRVNVFYGCT